MSMLDALADDFNITLADYGQTVTYTATGEDAASFSAVFGNETAEVRTYDDGQKTVRTAHVLCSTDDVASPDKKDTFTVGGVTWQVDDEMPSEKDGGTIMIPLIIFAGLETWARRERSDR
jgi:hypothetical protein